MGSYLRKSDLIDFILDDGHLVVTGTETSEELDTARKFLVYNDHKCTMVTLTWTDTQRERIQARARKQGRSTVAEATERKDRRAYYGA